MEKLEVQKKRRVKTKRDDKNTKGNRKGLSKIKNSGSNTCSVQPEQVPAPIRTLPLIGLETDNKIRLVCPGLEDVSLERQFGQPKFICKSIETVDKFILGCSDVKIDSTHKNDNNCTYNNPVINIRIDINNNNSDITQSHTLNCLSMARQSILTTDYECNDSIDNLLNILSNVVMDIDKLINTQKYLYQVKPISRVGLVKVVEKLSQIKPIKDTNYLFKINNSSEFYEVKPFKKVTAIDLLGGKYIDQQIFTGNFIVNKIKFENIEDKLEFMLDGHPVPVYIVHKSWVQDFNRGAIKLAKGDRIKAKTKIERSPLDNRITAYFFTEVLGINI